MSYNFIYGNIPNEWKIEKLENVTTFISRGRQPKYVEHSNIRTLNQKAIQWFEIKEEHYKYHNEEKEIPEKYFIKYNDIVLNSTGTGTVGRCYHFDYQPENLFADSHVTIIRTNENVLNPRFLMYQLSTKSYQEFILSGFITGSTGQVEFNKSKVQQLPILLPSIEEQNRIVDLVYSFDKKIENNKKMNFILEEMAQAIFKHWFVDFEFPNENGEPYKSSGGKFVESELGMIPEGWKINRIKDISLNFDSQRIPLSKRERDKKEKIYPYYGAASLMDYVDDYIFDGTYLLMGEDGTVIDKYGFPILQYVWGKFWVNNHAHVLQGNPPFSTEFLYLLLKNTNVSSIVTGAVQPKINQSNLNNIKVVCPPTDLLKRFNEIVLPIFDTKKNIKEQNKNLKSIRDYLLPKLMSGEIRIPEAEEAVESCLQKNN